MFQISEWKCLLWQLHYVSCCCILVLPIPFSQVRNCTVSFVLRSFRSLFYFFFFYKNFTISVQQNHCTHCSSMLLHYKRRSFCNVYENRFGKSIVKRQDDWLAFDNGARTPKHKEYLMRWNCLRWPRLFDWSLNKCCGSADNEKLIVFLMFSF